MSNADFNLIARFLPNLYLILDPQFNIVEATDNYLETTYTKRENIVGKNVFEVFPDNPSDPTLEGRGVLIKSLKEVLATKKAHKMPMIKYDIKGIDNTFEEKWWSVVNTPVLKDNEVVYIINSVTDVTEITKLKRFIDLQKLTLSLIASNPT